MKILLAMSGGVDSGCAGALLRRAGHEVIGVTLLVDGGGPAPEMRDAVAETCARLKITHRYLDVSKEFHERVIIPAAQEYAGGRTPNPCCLCNPAVKLGILLDLAASIGAGKLATGHYVRTVFRNGKTLLRRGSDRKKDQSYFLSLLPGTFPDRLLFPLGELDKVNVRYLANDFGFAFHNRADSQELCFVPPGVNAGDELLRRAGIRPHPGQIFYKGKAVGKHAGIHRITIGQRQGLEVALGVPGYVKAIDPHRGEVELTTEADELLCSKFTLIRCVFQQPQLLEREDLQIQIRYRSRPVRCRVERRGETCLIVPETPIRAVTPGQIGALYAGDLLVGGGIIDRTDFPA